MRKRSKYEPQQLLVKLLCSLVTLMEEKGLSFYEVSEAAEVGGLSKQTNKNIKQQQ